jgi:predicted acyltransferase
MGSATAAAPSKLTPAPIPGRVMSIDALRGFDMFWLMNGRGIALALAALAGGAWDSTALAQLSHSDWLGFTFWDYIAPLFLFCIGLSMPYSIAKRLKRGDTRRMLYRHIVQRTAILILLGWLMSGWLDFQPPLRLSGVLPRVALSYFIAALIVMGTGRRGQAIWTAGILLGYWAVMALAPVPGYGAGVYTPDGNFSGWLDRLLLPGKYCCAPYAPRGDHMGILGTFPSAMNVMLGVFCGYLVRSALTHARKLLILAGGGLACLGLGLAWGVVHPILTPLWTSSYVIYTNGWNMLLIALFYWIIDVCGWSKWAFPFTVIGMNAIAIYVLQSQVHFTEISNIFFRGVIRHSGSLKPLVSSTVLVGTEWAFLYLLYRKKIFIKV